MANGGLMDLMLSVRKDFILAAELDSIIKRDNIVDRVQGYKDAPDSLFSVWSVKNAGAVKTILLMTLKGQPNFDDVISAISVLSNNSVAFGATVDATAPKVVPDETLWYKIVALWASQDGILKYGQWDPKDVPKFKTFVKSDSFGKQFRICHCFIGQELPEKGVDPFEIANQKTSDDPNTALSGYKHAGSISFTDIDDEEEIDPDLLTVFDDSGYAPKGSRPIAHIHDLRPFVDHSVILGGDEPVPADRKLYVIKAEGYKPSIVPGKQGATVQRRKNKGYEFGHLIVKLFNIRWEEEFKNGSLSQDVVDTYYEFTKTRNKAGKLKRQPNIVADFDRDTETPNFIMTTSNGDGTMIPYFRTYYDADNFLQEHEDDFKAWVKIQWPRTKAQWLKKLLEDKGIDKNSPAGKSLEQAAERLWDKYPPVVRVESVDAQADTFVPVRLRDADSDDEPLFYLADYTALKRSNNQKVSVVESKK